MALGAVDTLRHQATWPLGTSLVQRGLIDEEQLRWALAVQQRTGSRLGSILIASGLVRRLDVYHVLSEMWQCPFVDLTTEPIDLTLVVAMDPRRLTSELWMPIRRLGDGSMIVATAEPPTSERATALANALQAPVRLVVTTDWDIRKCVSRLFADQILDEAVLGLWQRDESHSARKVLNNAQRVVVIGFLVVIAEGFLLAPVGTAVVISGTVGLGFLVSVFFKFAICMFGSRYEYAESVTHDEVAALRDDELPLYTILVPAYREANVVGALIANLSKLDYPPRRSRSSSCSKPTTTRRARPRWPRDRPTT